ncbi:glycosyl transferase group 1 [Fischerella thermalis WC341]|nr:glycosyl transferase group 1 [Fischerella thermalis WC341]
MQLLDGNHKLGDAMKVLICNERFLFRFGLDRVLMLIGKGMVERGNDVYMMGYWWDEPIVSQIAKKFIPVPPPTDDYANANESTTKWLENQWHNLFSESEKPDLVIIGGWPFFQALEFFSQVCQTVIFIDAGAVPLDGFVGHPLLIQQKLRNFRQRYLPKATAILPISDFIAKSQTIVDRGNSDGIHTVLLGADHMELSLWQAHMVSQSSGTNFSTLTALKETGRTYILNLGRWEPGCYKNSEACFEVIRELVQRHPQVTLLVLANPSDIKIPEDLKEYIKPIGFPDDAELQEIMKNVALGISVSLWEGFNLPLAEMQWLGRPALAFNLAAHPEVVVNPWFLCADVAEMAEKAGYVLTGQIPNEVISADNYNKFRENFRWEKVIQTYCDYFENALKASRDTTPILIVDVTNSCRDPGNSGVIRVTRQLCRTLQKYCDPVFVVWDWTTEQYVLPSQDGYLQLGQFNGPKLPTYAEAVLARGTISLDEFLALDPQARNRPALLFFPETVLDGHSTKAFAYAQKQQWKTAAILYDLIPVMYPQWCSPTVNELFPPYLEMLSSVDVIIPVSDFSARSIQDYCHRKNIKHGKISTTLLPGEFGQAARNVKMPKEQSPQVHMLCVSTLEPRKNHRTLLEACKILAQHYPQLNWRLTLVGNRYEGAPQIYEAVQKASAEDPRIQWLGIVDDARLHQLYEESTFTIYSSLIEGFGMPVLESIWHGRPCLCHNQGVMAELAAGGGCLVVDMTDAQALAQAIYNLSCDRTLLAELFQAAIDRTLKTWEDYAQEVLTALGLEETYAMVVNATMTQNLEIIRYEDLLYQNCLLERWQMHDSERMALAGLLARHQPRCSVEIGTYYGGSLSLIAQYSEMVFSIDIDPEVISRVPAIENVSFLTGASTTLLPLLFQALDEADIPIDFVLIDGDHSAEGVRRDIEIILTYVPKRPLFVMMHNSFNPECRRGMMSARWQDSPYVIWVDIDFVPGRIIEGENNLAKGEMWGGLALALLSPTPRQGDLTFGASANEFYEVSLKNSRH